RADVAEVGLFETLLHVDVDFVADLLGRVEGGQRDEEVDLRKYPDRHQKPDNARGYVAEEVSEDVHALRGDYPAGRGEGHREADPPALSDLVSDGAGEAGFGPRDQARGGGLQQHERRRVRASLLR